MKRILFTLLTIAATHALAADSPQPATPAPAPRKWQKVLPATPPGFTLQELTIAEYPEHTVKLHVYVPEKAGVFPAILDIHGGGWSQRQVEADKPMMERLATRGFVTAIVEYRLSGEAKYPAALDDCKAALRFMRANAAKLKLDPERIGVMGGSAGGHLSGLVAMTSGLSQFEGAGPFKEQSSTVKACIVMAATQDLAASDAMQSNKNVLAFFGVPFSENPELYKQASPITHVRAGVPPTIFIEGEKDTLKIGRAEMQDKLRALGIETALHTLKDAPHPFWMSQPWCDETVEIAAAFFKKHLGEPAPAK